MESRTLKLSNDCSREITLQLRELAEVYGLPVGDSRDRLIYMLRP
jgi:hypothetical protein